MSETEMVKVTIGLDVAWINSAAVEAYVKRELVEWEKKGFVPAGIGALDSSIPSLTIDLVSA